MLSELFFKKTFINSTYSPVDLIYASFLLLVIQGNLIIKLGVIFVGLLIGIKYLVPRKVARPGLFYLYFIATILLSYFTVGWLNSFNYFYSLSFSLVLWSFCFFLFVFNFRFIKTRPIQSSKNVLDLIFYTNTVISFFQIILLMVKLRTLNPYGGIFKTSTGDFIYGIFVNSSANMIVSAFFCFYYFFQKKKYRALVAGLVVLLTTYMSGILLAGATIMVVAILNPVIRFKYKIIGALAISGGILIFSLISPENLAYTKNNIKQLLSVNPPRKLVSFKETASFSGSGPFRFLVGSGPGKFSSRIAFVMGGEYVGWLPEKMKYRSRSFDQNHFLLWNKEVLSRPYQDGTANQPFSWYNQLIGEYGFIGTVIFIYMYLASFSRGFRKMKYGQYIFGFMLFAFMLDYWFEYISVMIIFEFIMLLQLKEINENQ